jgi:hypothetical protein
MSRIESEIEGIELGDKRLNKRSEQMLKKIAENSDKSLRGAFDGWGESKAAYRFFDNIKVEPQKIIAPHIEKTKQRFGISNVILCVQDTTIIDYSSRKKPIEGLGKIRYENDQGLLLHPTIAFTPENVCLGTICYKTWVRKELLGKEKRKIKKPIEERESIRWIESYRETEKLAQDYKDKIFINISDREGDCYELFAEHKEDSLAHIIVRGKNNRIVMSSCGKEKQQLWEAALKQETLGKVKFKVAASNKRETSREAEQSIKVCKIRIGSKFEGSKEINVVLATEENPPANEKKLNGCY